MSDDKEPPGTPAPAIAKGVFRLSAFNKLAKKNVVPETSAVAPEAALAVDDTDQPPASKQASFDLGAGSNLPSQSGGHPFPEFREVGGTSNTAVTDSVNAEGLEFTAHQNHPDNDQKPSLNDRFKFLKPKSPAPPTQSKRAVGAAHVQKNRTPFYLAVACVLFLVVLSVALYNQRAVDRQASENLKRSIDSAKKTASTLGSGFIGASNSMPITTQTVPLPAVEEIVPTPKAAASQQPDTLPSDGDARYKQMLGVIQNGNVTGGSSEKSATPMPYSPPPSAGSPAPVRKSLPVETKTVPSILEGQASIVIDEREQAAAAVPSIHADVVRAGSDVPYLVAQIDAKDSKMAYIVRSTDQTAAWMGVGDGLDGGFTIVSIRPYAVVVVDANKRLRTLRTVR